MPTARFDDVSPASESAAPALSAAPTLAEQTAFSERVARIGELMLKLERREGAVFEQLAERYAKLAQFRAVLEQREQIAFDERASRFVSLVEFARRLRLEQERRESEDFEAHLGRALKAQALMRRLSVERATP